MPRNSALPHVPLSPEDYVLESYDDRGGDRRYGFIYFETPNFDGQDVRMGYISGAWSEEAEADEKLHDTERYQPYIFTGNWGEPTFHHIIAAWDACVKYDFPGFKDYADAHPDSIRWMNGGELVAGDRFLLTLAGNRERQAYLRATRGSRPDGRRTASAK